MHSMAIEIIANDFLDGMASEKEIKPDFSNRDLMNALIIFQRVLMVKMYDCQDDDKMDFNDRLNMAFKCGNDLRELIRVYTGLDTHDTRTFL